MKRSIVDFHEDADSQWVAELACGHQRHTRHNPPFSERPWVLTSEGRQSQIGSELDCTQCDRMEIPQGYEPYRQSPEFDEKTVPEALLHRHSTKPGIWARIHVLHGSLDYYLHAPFNTVHRLTPHSPGVVLPGVEHHIEVKHAVSFFLEFFRPVGGRGPRRQS
jgi:tellurite methyltransferase